MLISKEQCEFHIANKSEVTCPKCLEKLKYDWVKPGVKCFTGEENGELHTIDSVNKEDKTVRIYAENCAYTTFFEQIFPVKYEPWTFETAPMFFVDSEEMEWRKASSAACEWGMCCFYKEKWINFYGMLEMFKKQDGSPCGNPVPDTEYYKQFDN